MIGLNNYIPNMVFTQRGIVDTINLVPGDIVYEYGTDDPLEVLMVERKECTTVYEVKYTDGRTMIYAIDDKILNGEGISYIQDLVRYPSFGNIKSFQMKFDTGNIKRPLYPDPYITGALIINGRYNTPYINLPLDKSAANQLFAHKYNLDFADKLENDTTFYAWNGGDTSKPITWKEFFPDYDFYVTSRKVGSPLIPTEYSLGSIRDRWKFIRGVFDVGYNCRVFPDSVGITNHYEERLIEVQQMLWSLGILSKITYDASSDIDKGRIYHLDIVGDYDGYPGFFYDINAIRDQLINDNKLYNHINPLKLSISSINKLHLNGVTIEDGYMCNLYLSKPEALYMTTSYLPRVSL